MDINVQFSSEFERVSEYLVKSMYDHRLYPVQKIRLEAVLYLTFLFVVNYYSSSRKYRAVARAKYCRGQFKFLRWQIKGTGHKMKPSPPLLQINTSLLMHLATDKDYLLSQK